MQAHREGDLTSSPCTSKQRCVGTSLHSGCTCPISSLTHEVVGAPAGGESEACGEGHRPGPQPRGQKLECSAHNCEHWCVCGLLSFKPRGRLAYPVPKDVASLLAPPEALLEAFFLHPIV